MTKYGQNWEESKEKEQQKKPSKRTKLKGKFFFRERERTIGKDIVAASSMEKVVVITVTYYSPGPLGKYSEEINLILQQK